MTDITKLFCNIDDFWKNFEPLYKEKLINAGKREPKRKAGLSLSEVMTIIVLFHIFGYRNFKTFYNGFVSKYLRDKFPNLPSYNRFVELKQPTVFPLHCYLMAIAGKSTGIAFVDSTSLKVCHPKRIRSHKVFKNIAKRGKTSTGWFYGLKLHMIVNDRGEILALMISAGNVDDRQPVPDMCKNVIGKLVGDKGYISKKLFNELMEHGVQLITKIKKNMKNKLMPFIDKLILRKRGIIETIFDQLKNISQIEHSRHRSPINFLVNLFGGLIAYSLQPKKPSLKLSKSALNLLELN
jgi:hypothetical protein